jgi:hypothetical protein
LRKRPIPTPATARPAEPQTNTGMFNQKNRVPNAKATITSKNSNLNVMVLTIVKVILYKCNQVKIEKIFISIKKGA